jgi:hypothetical protein
MKALTAIVATALVGCAPKQAPVQSIETQQRSVEEAIASVENQYDIRFRYFFSPICWNCNEDIYTITDRDGTSLGQFTVSKQSNGDTFIWEFNKWMSAPRYQLRAIVAADKALNEDMTTAESMLGLQFYVPSAYSVEQRTSEDRKSQVLNVTVEHCTADSYVSSELFARITVPIFEHIPGTENYAPEDIYHQGDLLIYFFSPAAREVVHIYEKILESNRQFCPKKHSDHDWEIIGQTYHALPTNPSEGQQ